MKKVGTSKRGRDFSRQVLVDKPKSHTSPRKKLELRNLELKNRILKHIDTLLLKLPLLRVYYRFGLLETILSLDKLRALGYRIWEDCMQFLILLSRRQGGQGRSLL